MAKKYTARCACGAVKFEFDRERNKLAGNDCIRS